ncbi:MAG: hypothetical protein NPIRA04_07940 [Nitrospirales bacterium]|nr:MAG: hypothetical protein NPIRA04_07940 [Nitrospirales bacterium]
MVPYPWAKALFIWGSPLWVEALSSREVLEEKRLELERTLDQITREAEAEVSEQ